MDTEDNHHRSPGEKDEIISRLQAALADKERELQEERDKNKERIRADQNVAIQQLTEQLRDKDKQLEEFVLERAQEAAANEKATQDLLQTIIGKDSEIGNVLEQALESAKDEQDTLRYEMKKALAEKDEELEWFASGCELVAEIDQLKADVEALKKDLNKKDKLLAEAKESLVSLQDGQNAVTAVEEALESTNYELEDLRFKMKEALREKDEEIEWFASGCELVAEIDQLKAQVDTLKKDLNKKDKLLAKAKEALEPLQNYQDAVTANNVVPDLVEKELQSLRQSGIKIAHLNCRSLRNKIDELRLLLLWRTDIDVMTLSETHIRSNDAIDSFNVAGYTILESKERGSLESKERGSDDDDLCLDDDGPKTGGGVLTYVKTKYAGSARKCSIDLEEGLEAVCVEIELDEDEPKLKDQANSGTCVKKAFLRIINVYVPPKRSEQPELLEKLHKSMDNLKKADIDKRCKPTSSGEIGEKKQSCSCKTNYVILGDFNCDQGLEGEKFPMLYKLESSHQLSQLIKDFTRVVYEREKCQLTFKKTETLIDLVYTDDRASVLLSGVVHIAMSDHFMVYCILKRAIKDAVLLPTPDAASATPFSTQDAASLPTQDAASATLFSMQDAASLPTHDAASATPFSTQDAASLPMQDAASATPFSTQDAASLPTQDAASATPFSMQDAASATPFSTQDAASATPFLMQDAASLRTQDVASASPFSTQEAASATPFSTQDAASATPFLMQDAASLPTQDAASATPFPMQDAASSTQVAACWQSFGYIDEDVYGMIRDRDSAKAQEKWIKYKHLKDEIKEVKRNYKKVQE